jgi:NAD(P)-dependent dehydrogenase (short-subunit alcohol dehydrogenase family)
MREASLAGQVAVVTGASRPGGIGREIARTFALAGADVVVSDIERPLEGFPDYQLPDTSELAATAEELVALGVRATAVPCDVTVEADVVNLVDTTAETHGRLDIFVNNAGVSLGLVPLADLTVAAWDRNLEVMARGTFLGTREAIRAMRAGGRGGRIINMSSQAGKTGWPMLAAYSAAKFAVIGLTQSAALEVGPDGITVNAICPGTVDTPLLEIDGGPMDVFSRLRGISREEARERQRRAIPLRRFATPADIAAMALFLASDAGSFITGEAINVTGGEEVH